MATAIHYCLPAGSAGVPLIYLTMGIPALMILRSDLARRRWRRNTRPEGDSDSGVIASSPDVISIAVYGVTALCIICKPMQQRSRMLQRAFRCGLAVGGSMASLHICDYGKCYCQRRRQVPAGPSRPQRQDARHRDERGEGCTESLLVRCSTRGHLPQAVLRTTGPPHAPPRFHRPRWRSRPWHRCSALSPRTHRNSSLRGPEICRRCIAHASVLKLEGAATKGPSRCGPSRVESGVLRRCVLLVGAIRGSSASAKNSKANGMGLREALGQ
jgi:hypothetical protein